MYTNEARSAQVIGLYVNGEAGTRVAFPPTKGAMASVWIQAKLDRKGEMNKLTFDTSCASGLKIQSIDCLLNVANCNRSAASAKTSRESTILKLRYSRCALPWRSLKQLRA